MQFQQSDSESRNTEVFPECSNSSSNQTQLTHSQTPTTDWSVCVICLKKSHKKDKILHKIQTKTAEKTLKDAAMCKLR